MRSRVVVAGARRAPGFVMQKAKRKLSLNRETLVTMTDGELPLVQGASTSLVVASAAVATMRVCPQATAKVCPKVVPALKKTAEVVASNVGTAAIYDISKNTLGFGDKK